MAGLDAEVFELPFFGESLSGQTSIDGYFAATQGSGGAPPVIEDIDPPNGSRGISRTRPVTFTVRDVDSDIRALVLGVTFASAAIPDDVIYWLGNFTSRFASSTAVVQPDASIDFEIIMSGGWPGDPIFFPLAVDVTGNINV